MQDENIYLKSKTIKYVLAVFALMSSNIFEKVLLCLKKSTWKPSILYPFHASIGSVGPDQGRPTKKEKKKKFHVLKLVIKNLDLDPDPDSPNRLDLFLVNTDTIPLMGWAAKRVYLREGQRRRAGEWAGSAPWQEAGACRSAPIGSQPTNQNPGLVISAHILPITLLNLYIQLMQFAYQNSIISLTDLRL